MGELLVCTGCTRVRASEALQQTWRTLVGRPLGEHTHVGGVRRGVLEVFVQYSALLQELAFLKPRLLAELHSQLPDQRIRDVRFRLAPVA